MAPTLHPGCSMRTLVPAAAGALVLLAFACQPTSEAGNDAPVDVPCSLALPRTVNLGLVPVGLRTRAPVPVENLRSDEACRIDEVRLEDCDPDFALEAAGPFEVVAGEPLQVPVTLAPDTTGPRACTLVLATEHETERIPIRATADPCLEVPETLGFGPVASGCVGVETLPLSQGCDVDVTLEGIEVEGGAFAVSSAPLPVTLARGQNPELEVRFVAGEAGLVDGTLRLRFAGGAEPRVVRLYAESSGTPPDDLF